MTHHDLPGLGGYVLGMLGPDEIRAVQEHLAGCGDCRAEHAVLAEARNWLAEVPPEVLLDGPPESGDRVLHRALREAGVADSESRQAELGEHQDRTGPADHAPRRRRRVVPVAAGIAVVALTTGVGGVIGRQTAPETQPVAVPTPGHPTSVTSAVGRVLAGSDPGTGASMTATVTPAVGWVRIHAQVNGVPAGTRCQLVVVSRGGATVVAGSWLVSPAGERQGTTLDGSALVVSAEIGSVAVVTLDGRTLVSTRA